MTTYFVTKKGQDDWDDLVGKEIGFSWSDGWEDYYIRMTFAGTQPQDGGDPRYPKYFITDDDGGGFAVWWDAEVEVTVYG